MTDFGLIESVLNKAEICRVAFSQDGQPYIVPLSYGYEPGRIFFHSATAGRKLDIISSNPRVCFELEYGCKLVRADTPCDFTFHFTSVIGSGRASIVTDPDEKARGLNLIVSHYGSAPQDYSPSALAKLAVVKIEIDEMSCKKSPLPTLP